MKKIILLYSFAFYTMEAQVITTFAGTGVGSYTGDGGLAINATLSEPKGVAFDGAGNVYIADEDANVIRKVNSSGIISTFAGTGVIGYSGDGGPAASAKLDQPAAIAFDRQGNLYISDTYNNVIRKVNTFGIITTIAGTGAAGFGGDGGPAVSAQFNQPEGLVVDKNGVVYVADASNNRVRMISVSGTITTIAGTGMGAFSGDGGPAAAAQLHYPTGIALDTLGNIYIADNNNNRVRKINTSGIITTFAGTGVAGYSGNGGPASLAKLNAPVGLSADTAGNIFVADGGNSVIRRIKPSGVISTFAGNGILGYSGDGGAAILAQEYTAPGVAADKQGNVFIADYFNSRVRKVSYCASPINVPINGTTSVCAGDSTLLTASGATTYTWSANAGSATTYTVYVKPAVNTTYTLTGVSGQCVTVDTVQVMVSNCSSGIEVKDPGNFKIFPNPVSYILNIETSTKYFLEIQLYNWLGEMVLHEKAQNQRTKLYLGYLEKGVYLLKLTGDNNTVYHSIMLKE